MKKILLAVVIILIFGIGATAAFAQPAASQGVVEMKASVTKLEGEVIITKAGTSVTQPAKIGDMLGSGDKIETKDTGKIEIKIANGNTLNLTPNSQIVLSKLTSNPATGEYENMMESKFGTIRAHVAQKIKGKSAFKVKTPTAMCGARGTVFYIVVSGADTRVFVTDGSVDFSNPNTGDTFVVVQNMTSLSSATGVSDPVELTDADKAAVLAAYNASLAGGSDAPEGEGGETQNNPNEATQENTASPK